MNASIYGYHQHLGDYHFVTLPAIGETIVVKNHESLPDMRGKVRDIVHLLGDDGNQIIAIHID